MNVLTNYLKNQTLDAYNWSIKLIDNIPDNKWFTNIEIIDTNIAWQIGHLTLSQYYYTIVLVNGPHKEVSEKINIKKYSGLFANGLKRKELFAEMNVNELKENWHLIQNLTVETLTNLQDDRLYVEIFKMPKPHPFVKTKENAISWNIKHTMWHCGQMGILKRIIDKPLDFGM